MRLGGMAASTSSCTGSDESEDEEEDSWENDDSDGEYGKPAAKRGKSVAKGPMRRNVKMEDSNEEDRRSRNSCAGTSYHDARMRRSHRNDSPQGEQCSKHLEQ